MPGSASETEEPDFTGRFRAIIARYARGEQTLEEAAKDFAQVWEESAHAPRAVRSPRQFVKGTAQRTPLASGHL